jgi:hopene-associated glycosyltransferase HpnB
MLLSIAGAAVCGIWLYLLLGRGWFWLMRDRAASGGMPAVAPQVVAVIPARNEAPVVGHTIRSLAKQQYPGAFHIVLVDDASEDGTDETAGSAASPEVLTIVRGKPLPRGWTGKLWAVSQGIQEARRFSPDYFLLTDADIVHPPIALKDLIAQAENGGYDLVSWMVRLRCHSLAERALIPAYVFIFLMLYPPAWIRSPRHPTAGAAGGCMLVRREILERIGGIEAIRSEVIDDCALARAIKKVGGRVRLELGPDARSIRAYETFAEIGRLISRNAFAELRHSGILLAGTVVGIVVTYLLPLAFSGNIFGITAWALLTMAYVPALRFHRCSVFWAPLLPLIALFYLGATIHSAVAFWCGAGGMWKGRVQDKR